MRAALTFLIAAVPVTATASDGYNAADRVPSPASNVTVDLSVLEDLHPTKGAQRTSPSGTPILRPPLRPILRAPSPPTDVAPVLEPPPRRLHVDKPAPPVKPDPAVAAIIPRTAVTSVRTQAPPAPRARPVVALKAAGRDVLRSSKPRLERTERQTVRVDPPPQKPAVETVPTRPEKPAAATAPAPRNRAPIVKRAVVAAVNVKENAPNPSRSIAAKPKPRTARRPVPAETGRPAAPVPQRTPDVGRLGDVRVQTAALSPTAEAANTFAPARVTFHTRRVVLTDSDRAKIRDIASRLKRDSSLRLELLAYAAEGPLSPSEARRLSLVRALAIRSRLLEAGVLSTRISVRALGGKSKGGPPDRVDLIVSAR